MGRLYDDESKVNVTVRITEEMRDEIDRECAVKGVKRPDIARDALRMYLDAEMQKIKRVHEMDVKDFMEISKKTMFMRKETYAALFNLDKNEIAKEAKNGDIEIVSFDDAEFVSVDHKNTNLAVVQIARMQQNMHRYEGTLRQLITDNKKMEKRIADLEKKVAKK